ncbi:MAG: hypothetical protein JSV56_09100 [Methanomassiliicoccales archaeon]|nr:MAG: hypothetical protein JSV56_09100 [Methanomassiliicoccales archaeon]
MNIQAATCPTCRGALAWVESYRQWYCNNCRQYYPPGGQPPKGALDNLSDELGGLFDSKPQHPVYYCNVCRTQLSWIQQYGRWYCSTCRNYV